MQRKVEESLTKTLDNLWLMNDLENHSSIELLVEMYTKIPLRVDKFSANVAIPQPYVAWLKELLKEP